jgi:hypothetical protein
MAGGAQRSPSSSSSSSAATSDDAASADSLATTATTAATQRADAAAAAADIAVEWLSEALRLCELCALPCESGDRVRIMLVLAGCLVQAERDLPRARHLVAEALVCEPHNSVALALEARLLALLGDAAAAERALERLLGALMAALRRGDSDSDGDGTSVGGERAALGVAMSVTRGAAGTPLTNVSSPAHVIDTMVHALQPLMARPEYHACVERTLVALSAALAPFACSHPSVRARVHFERFRWLATHAGQPAQARAHFDELLRAHATGESVLPADVVQRFSDALWTLGADR